MLMICTITTTTTTTTVIQAAANVAVAKRFKEEGRCSEYVEMVEKKGVALCHFHGYIKKSVLPPNMVSGG